MALQDVERLYRALKTGATTEIDELTRSTPGVEKLFRDARAALIEDGMNEVMSLTAARRLIDGYAVDRPTPERPRGAAG
jgi:alkylation response protein AidB-like acyl-CoA dehydrogenase